MSQERPYSPKSLAERWGCSAKHIRDLCDDRALPFFRCGRLIRIRSDAVDAFERGTACESGKGQTAGGTALTKEASGTASEQRAMTKPYGLPPTRESGPRVIRLPR
jgi:excisionase family DNA binding protein